MWTQHKAGVGDKSSRSTFGDPEVPIPKILNRLEEEKKPRVLLYSSRPGCGWITGVPFCLQTPRRVRAQALGSFRPGLRDPGYAKWKGVGAELSGRAPPPHRPSESPRGCSSSEDRHAVVPVGSNSFPLFSFSSFFLSFVLFEGTDGTGGDALNGEVDIKIPGSVNKISERK